MINAVVLAMAAGLPPIRLDPKLGPWVAMSCRIYYPPGDSRTSYHQIYVCDLHGGHRKQLTFDVAEHTDVRWVGDHTLAWVQTRGVTSHETEFGFHSPPDDGSRTEQKDLVVLNLNTGKKHVVASGLLKATGVGRHGFVAYRRGEAVYVGSRSSGVEDPSTEKVYALNPQDGKPLKVPPAPKFDSNLLDAGESGSRWSRLKLDCPPVDHGSMFEYEKSGAAEGDERVTFRGHSVYVPACPEYIWSTDTTDGWFFLCGSYAGSGGCDEWIYLVDWRAGRCRCVANEVLNIDFDPDCRYWGARTNNKTTTDLGKKRVWSGDLWVGDVKTRKQWKITSGVVHGVDARIQPVNRWWQRQG